MADVLNRMEMKFPEWSWLNNEVARILTGEIIGMKASGERNGCHLYILRK